MRPWLTLAHVWPGLPQLWRRGSWSALGVAVGFSVLLNAALVTHGLYPERFPVYVRGLACSAAAAFWFWATRRAWRQGRIPFGTGDAVHEGLYLRAQGEYLRGHWYEAESLVRPMVRRVPEDVETRLLLVSLLRRTGRASEAIRELRTLSNLPGAEKWAWELERERASLEKRNDEDERTLSLDEHRSMRNGGDPSAAAQQPSRKAG